MSSSNPNGESHKPSFWNTLPGLITAIAALITALGTVLYKTHQFRQEVVVHSPQGPSLSKYPPGVFTTEVGQHAENPLREGKYELLERNGHPLKSGVIMELSLTDDHFSVRTTRHMHELWSGHLSGKDHDWNLVIDKPGKGPAMGLKGPAMGITMISGNPGGGPIQVTRQGARVTFKGPNGTFVWRSKP